MIDADDVLDLLDLWWRHEHRWSPVRGYPTQCPSTLGYQAAKHWDGDSGAVDADVESLLAQRIGHMVAQIEQPWRSALHVLARNRSGGVSVWSVASMPSDPDERTELLSQAVDRLRGLL